MKKLDSISGQFRARASVGVIASLIFFQSLSGNASTGSSWNHPPSWNAEESQPRRSMRSMETSSDVSPYTPGSNNLALDLGQVFLMGGLSEKYENSLGTQLHYTYGVSDLFGFDSSLGYSEHSDGKYSMVTVLTGLRVNISWYDRVIPYVVVGLGFYRPNFKDTTIPIGATSPAGNASLSSVLFGVHFGPGIDLALSRNVFFGAALTFHNMFGTTKTQANGTPLDIGGSYMSFLMHIGATF